jgi:hypothetical protein
MVTDSCSISLRKNQRLDTINAPWPESAGIAGIKLVFASRIGG